MSVENDIEKEARNMGWVPQDEFKGNKDHWVDAETFVEKGQHVMPILRENNKRLQKELLTRDQRLGTLESELQAANVALQKLEGHYKEATKRAVAEAKQGLIAQLRKAREDNDTDAEQQLLDKLDEVREKEREVSRQPEPKKEDPPNPDEAYTKALSKEFQEWEAENSWYGIDKKRTKEYIRLAEDLRDEGNTLRGREFMDEVDRVWKGRNKKAEEVDEDDGAPVNKVEGGNNRSGARGGGKTFASLPAEAKKACHDDAADLVGEGKAFKTLSDWEKEYTKIYYSMGD